MALLTESVPEVAGVAWLASGGGRDHGWGARERSGLPCGQARFA
jgi:hypothetical protein